MTKKNTYFPQGHLLSIASEKPPEEKKPDAKIRGLVQSTLGAQQMVPLAKLKGNYIPEAIISKILAQKSAPDTDKYFMSLENHKISSLTPEIRIYRRSKDNNIVPFYFPVVSDYDFEGATLNLSKTFSSNSAVIENFSVTYTGKNPYSTTRNFVDATLTVSVDNISTLFHEPKQAHGQYAPLADLFTIRVQGGSKKTPDSNKTRPANALDSGSGTNILVVLGYANHQTEVLTSREMEMINDNRVVVNLYYSSHDLNMQQDGSATVTIRYTGALQASSGDILLDMITPKESKSKIIREKIDPEKEREKKRKSIKEGGFAVGDQRTEEQKKKAKAVQDKEVEKMTINHITSQFRKIFETLYSTGKVYSVFYRDNFKLKKVVGATKPSAEDGKITPGDPPSKFYDFADEPVYIKGKNPFSYLYDYRDYYVTFGDFLDAYFKFLETELTGVLSYTKKVLEKSENKSIKKLLTPVAKEIEQSKEKLFRLTVLMCDFKYAIKTENTAKKVQKTMNVADIPIAIDTLYTLVYDEMISTRRFWMDINSFLTNLLTKLLSRSFGELPAADFLKDVDFVVTNFTGKPCNNKIKKGELKLQDLPKPLGEVSKEELSKTTEYYVIHQKSPSWTRAVGSGSKKEDLKKGIFHLRASQDRGLVKSISFSKVSQPARETYMIFRNGQMYDELRYPHNATVEMFGNNLFRPMSLVYINPDTLGFGDPRGTDSIARRLGFGGYYVAGPVTTTYTGGQLSTSMTLYFNAFPEVSSQGDLSETIKRSIKDLT